MLVYVPILVETEMYHILGDVNQFVLSNSYKKACIKFKVYAKFTSDLFISTINENIPVRRIQMHATVHLESTNGKLIQ